MNMTARYENRVATTPEVVENGVSPLTYDVKWGGRETGMRATRKSASGAMGDKEWMYKVYERFEIFAEF